MKEMYHCHHGLVAYTRLDRWQAAPPGAKCGESVHHAVPWWTHMAAYGGIVHRQSVSEDYRSVNAVQSAAASDYPVEGRPGPRERRASAAPTRPTAMRSALGRARGDIEACPNNHNSFAPKQRWAPGWMRSSGSGAGTNTSTSYTCEGYLRRARPRTASTN